MRKIISSPYANAKEASSAFFARAVVFLVLMCLLTLIHRDTAISFQLPAGTASDHTYLPALRRVPAKAFGNEDSVPGATALIAPANGATELQSPVTLRWLSVPTATSYDIIFDMGTIATVTDTTYLLYVGPYENCMVNVRTRNAAGLGQYSNTVMFSTYTPPGEPQQLSSQFEVPHFEDLGVLLGWTAPSTATSYELKISSAIDFQGLSVLFDTVVDVPSCLFDHLRTGNKYYWEVEASNQYGSGTEAVDSFYVATTTPGVVQLISPANGSTNVSASSATLQWSSSSLSLAYVVQIAEDSLFRTIGYSQTINGTSCMPGALPSLGKLYWRVAGFGEGGIGPWSDVYHFTTDLAGLGLPTFPFISQNFPNPFASSTTFLYGVDQPAYVKLVIYNTLGRKVRTLVDQSMGAGFYQVRLDGSSLPSGAYYEVLTVGAFTASRNLMLLK